MGKMNSNISNCKSGVSITYLTACATTTQEQKDWMDKIQDTSSSATEENYSLFLIMRGRGEDKAHVHTTIVWENDKDIAPTSDSIFYLGQLFDKTQEYKPGGLFHFVFCLREKLFDDGPLESFATHQKKRMRRIPEYLKKACSPDNKTPENEHLFIIIKALTWNQATSNLDIEADLVLVDTFQEMSNDEKRKYTLRYPVKISYHITDDIRTRLEEDKVKQK